MSIAHVLCGRPTVLLSFVVPPQLLQKTAREILQTIPGARVYVIDSLRSQRPGQAGPQGVNELRLRNGRIVRDGVHTTPHRYEVARQVQIRMGPLGCRARARATLCDLRSGQGQAGAFWRPSFQVARAETTTAQSSTRTVAVPSFSMTNDCCATTSTGRSDSPRRWSRSPCAAEKESKPRRPLYSPLWQVDGSRIRRYAPIEFIGRFLPALLQIRHRR